MTVETWNIPFEKNDVKETAEAFENFIIYRDMKDRSLKKLEKKTKIKYNKLAYWSKTYNWRNRINEMLKHNAAELSKERLDVEKEAINIIKDRIILKNEIIRKLYKSLEKEMNKKRDRTDLKELINMFRSLESIENLNIDNIKNIQSLEDNLKSDDVDAADLRNTINNFNVMLTAANNDAIDVYDKELKDDKF